MLTIASVRSILNLRLKLSIVISLCLLSIARSGCSVPKDNAGAQNKPLGAERSQATAVDVAIAATVPLASTREYTGTTQPVQEVAIRAQAEGQLRQLNVNVDDRVKLSAFRPDADDRQPEVQIRPNWLLGLHLRGYCRANVTLPPTSPIWSKSLSAAAEPSRYTAQIVGGSRS